MKKEDLKNKFVQEYSHVPPTLYSVGVEIEFVSPRLHEYLEYIRSQARLYDEGSPYLGVDGSCHVTPEFRSPVFTSDDPKSCFEQAITFSIDVQKMLKKDYRAIFRPYPEASCPCGIHVSIGGKFLNAYYLRNAYPRYVEHIKIQEELIPPSVVDEYKKRLNRYPCTLRSADTTFTTEYPPVNSYRYSSGRLELRVFPSCHLESLIPHLEFILLDGSASDKKLKFSRNTLL